MGEPIWTNVYVERVERSDPRFGDEDWASRYVRLHEVLDDLIYGGEVDDEADIYFGEDMVPALHWSGEANYGGHGTLGIDHFDGNTFAQECEQLGIAWRIVDDPKYDYDGELTCWRPGWPTTVSRTVTASHDVVIRTRDLLRWIDRGIVGSLEDLREPVERYEDLSAPIPGIDYEPDNQEAPASAA